jgi:Molecular chaperone
VDLGAARAGWGEVSISSADYYERCRPMVEETLAAAESLLEAHDQGTRLDAVYVTGGGSELPLIARVLRERFGRKVKRSPYTRSATAIGLAIQADSHTGYLLREKFTRHFGVWRETQAGRQITFDPLFAKGTPLPGPGEPPLVITRSYCPVHNIGHFRYLECSQRTGEGQPSGDIALWDEIRFPFDPVLKDAADLHPTPVRHDHSLSTHTIEESYQCNSSGSVTVVIRNVTSGHHRQYRLGHWSAQTAPVVPGRKKRTAGKR